MAVIAGRIGCDESTVRRHLLASGIRSRPRGPSPLRPIPDWSPSLAYAVGLIATDGCLSRTRHGIDLLDVVRRCLELTNAITPYGSGRCHHIQWRDRFFHAVSIPKPYFCDFVRGCVDGDGTIVAYVDCSLSAKKVKYVCRRAPVSFGGCAPRWQSTWGSTATCPRNAGPGVTRYAKAESIRLLRWIYYAPNVPCLARSAPRPSGFSSRQGTARAVRSADHEQDGCTMSAACRGGGTRQTRSTQNRVPVRA